MICLFTRKILKCNVNFYIFKNSNNRKKVLFLKIQLIINSV